MSRQPRTARLCPNLRCQAPLSVDVDRLGRTVIHCEPCARWQAGRCVDCHRPRENRRARRCERCRHHRVMHVLPLKYRKARGRKHVDALTREQNTRRLAGKCIDCGSLEKRGKSFRCEPCKRLAQSRADRKCYAKHAEERRAYGRAYMQRPDVRERKVARLKQWREQNPYKRAMQKRRERMKIARDPAYRAKRLAYYARYRAERRARPAPAERAA